MFTKEWKEAQMSNALVAHKNLLIELIDAACDIDDLMFTERALAAVQKLWSELDYGYKWDELWKRFCLRCDSLGFENIYLTLDRPMV